LDIATMTCILVLAALLGSTPAQPVGSQAHQQAALRSLSVARPDVNWDPKSALSADFDCDGSVDEAFLGRAAGKAFVGVVLAADKGPEILEFGVGGIPQDAICQEHVTLAIESLNYDPAKDIGKIDGFRRSRHCKGLLLSGGECDPIDLYWNFKTNYLGWWRL
jgi:hypothetical protein